jgi:hypothetical protein
MGRVARGHRSKAAVPMPQVDGIIMGRGHPQLDVIGVHAGRLRIGRWLDVTLEPPAETIDVIQHVVLVAHELPDVIERGHHRPRRPCHV